MKIKRLFNYKNTQFDDQLKSVPHNFAVKHDEKNNVSELTIYGIIGETWWSDTYTSPSDVDKALNEANGNDILIRLNSPGGNAFDGVAIYNRLIDYKQKHNAKITTRIDGYACSAASLPPLASDEVIMGLGSMFMIHEASTGVWGTKSEFRNQANVLEKIEEGIIDIYSTKANISRDEIREKVDDETWFSASEAVKIGFATSTAIADGKDEEIANLKNQLQTMEEQIKNLTNQQNQEPMPVEPTMPTNKRKGFLF